MISVREAWLRSHDEQTPLDATALDLAFEWSTEYGSSNGWAGSSAEAARIIRSLLLEIHRLNLEAATRSAVS